MKFLPLLVFLASVEQSVFGIRPYIPISFIRNVKWVRGGHTSASLPASPATSAPQVDRARTEEQPLPSPAPSVKVTVLTNAGSPHIDSRTRFVCSTKDTVADVKRNIEEKMNGHPPTSLQRLVFGLR
jgi:hypothetical protein